MVLERIEGELSFKQAIYRDILRVKKEQVSL